MIEETRHRPRPPGARDAAVQADAHHPPAFLGQLVEGVAQ
jgi:hypothetical protein